MVDQEDSSWKGRLKRTLIHHKIRCNTGTLNIGPWPAQRTKRSKRFQTNIHGTSLCNPVTLHQHKLSVPTDVAFSRHPSDSTICWWLLLKNLAGQILTGCCSGGLVFLLESVHVLLNGFVNSRSHIRNASKTNKYNVILPLYLLMWDLWWSMCLIYRLRNFAVLAHWIIH